LNVSGARHMAALPRFIADFRNAATAERFRSLHL